MSINPDIKAPIAPGFCNPESSGNRWLFITPKKPKIISKRQSGRDNAK